MAKQIKVINGTHNPANTVQVVVQTEPFVVKGQTMRMLLSHVPPMPSARFALERQDRDGRWATVRYGEHATLAAAREQFDKSLASACAAAE
jgi:hypothetical protein